MAFNSIILMVNMAPDQTNTQGLKITEQNVLPL